MEELMKQYGPAILTAVVIVALIGIIVGVLMANEGPVKKAFDGLIKSFLESANGVAGSNSLKPPSTGTIIVGNGWSADLSGVI